MTDLIDWVSEVVADTPHPRSPRVRREALHVDDGFVYACDGHRLRVVFTGHKLPKGSLALADFRLWEALGVSPKIDRETFDYRAMIDVAKSKTFNAELKVHDNGGIEVVYHNKG